MKTTNATNEKTSADYDQRGEVLCTTSSLLDARCTRRELSKFYATGALRIMRRSQRYTIPYRGITVHVEYTVEVRP
ncbi:MAG: hypothetical protein KGK07_16400 [Chloroflexota bacterium]|nr:hypothetical protein [Chloroflexota bacterium]